MKTAWRLNLQVRGLTSSEEGVIEVRRSCVVVRTQENLGSMVAYLDTKTPKSIRQIMSIFHCDTHLLCPPTSALLGPACYSHTRIVEGCYPRAKTGGRSVLSNVQRL